MSLLRPGLHVVRRDDHHLQVGIDPPWRLVVPDQPDVRRLLADLAAGRMPAPDTPAAHRVLRELLAADLLVDPGSATAVRRARSSTTVSVEASRESAAGALRLVQAAGCEVAAPDESDLALVLADGEPLRELVDAHQRAGRPHLVVAGGVGGWTVGPFVEPGITACLRCADAHSGELDPRRAVVVEQVGGRAAGPVDPALLALATAWAVRDLLAHIDGDRPSTWSASVEIGPDLEPRRRVWSRHPHCGCCWAEGLVG